MIGSGSPLPLSGNTMDQTVVLGLSSPPPLSGNTMNQTVVLGRVKATSPCLGLVRLVLSRVQTILPSKDWSEIGPQSHTYNLVLLKIDKIGP